jgi:hypothetical protein
LARIVSLAINNIALSNMSTTVYLYADTATSYVLCVALGEIGRKPIKNREK